MVIRMLIFSDCTGHLGEEEERVALDEAKRALSGIMDGTCRPFKVTTH
jgi:hypothetical protein